LEPFRLVSSFSILCCGVAFTYFRVKSTKCLCLLPVVLVLVLVRGATTAEKLRGTKVWVQTPGRLHPAPGQRQGWGGCRRGSPPPAVGVRGVTPEKILKTQMLNPAFW